MLALLMGIAAGCTSNAPEDNSGDTNAPAPAENQGKDNDEEKQADSQYEIGDDILSRLPMDPEQLPDNTMNYVILKGSWYEMGVQYGQQDKTSVVHTAAIGLSKASHSLGTRDKEEIRAAEKYYEDLLMDWFPAIIDFCKGQADSTGMEYQDILLGYVGAGPEFIVPDGSSNQCSMVSAWGEATENGDLVAAYNSDRTLDPTAYQSCIIAFPDDGNAFICARDMIGPTINDQGLVVMSTGGQGGLETDEVFGVPYSLPIVYCAAYCSTAKEAYEEVDKISISGALNLMISDGKDAYHLETTSSHKAWRQPGDFGEKDYLIANNHYLTEEMQSSLYTDHSYDDCPYRYATVEEILKQEYGAINVETLRKAEASTSFFDIETGTWKNNTWNPAEVYNAPEALSSSYKTAIRHVANATTRTVYECRGQQEILSSFVPYAIGTFSQVTLDSDVAAMVRTAKDVLGRLLMDAAKDIDLSGARDDAERMEILNKAKEFQYLGYNYQTLAESAVDEAEELFYYSRALNAYCDGQCYARLALNEPYVIQ